MDAGPDLPVLSEKTINLAHTIDQYNRCRGGNESLMGLVGGCTDRSYVLNLWSFLRELAGLGSIHS